MKRIEIEELKGYFGGKEAAGVPQFLINRIPQHKVFVSAFLGNCAVMRIKRQAELNIGIDLDKSVIEAWVKEIEFNQRQYSQAGDNPFSREHWDIHRGNAIQELSPYSTMLIDSIIHRRISAKSKDVFVFLDPPYLSSTRKSAAKYKYDMGDIEDHKQLLSVAKKLPYKIMICAYRNKFYDEELGGWYSEDYSSKTRGGVATETIYMNYAAGEVLHDYAFVGKNRRERENNRRLIRRHLQQLHRMPEIKRNALIDAILRETFDSSEFPYSII